MKKYQTIDGNESTARVAYMFTEVAGIYPITPSSPMAELVDEYSNNDKKNIFNDTVKVVEMQSEAGAAGLVHGSLRAGCLTTTFTSSQGLLLMIPNMYKLAGEMLPAVFHVAARSLSTHALSIFGDHQDIYATRQTGFCMISSSSVQDTAILSGIAHLSAIKTSLPFMHFFDGFRTSHEINKIEVLEKDDFLKHLDIDALEKFRNKALNPMNPSIIGTSQNGDIYFQATEVRNKYYDVVPDVVNDYMKKINMENNFNYKPFNYYGTSNPENVIVAMGSVCETIKETIELLNSTGYNVGLIEVHLYRPFSSKYLMEVIPKTVKKIAVLDRTKEAGSTGEPLYLDVVEVLKNTDIKIVKGRYGLSSKDTNPSQIKAIYDMLNNNIKEEFTIGIEDDVTNLSLNIDNKFKIDNSLEFLIYGYGSDGMVSASKSIIKLVGDSTNKYVQGYFEYDSKKSGGVTVGHLRFNENPIRSTYYVENPYLIVCTKDSYLSKYYMIDNIKENGIFILNTNKTNKEISELITQADYEIIKNRNIKFYKINANDLGKKYGLENRVSTIMESVIFYVTNIIDYEQAKEEIKKISRKKYFKKGEKIIVSNNIVIDKASSYLEEVVLLDCVNNIEEKDMNLYDEIDSRRGDKLPTSAFLNNIDGKFEAGTSSKDKRTISEKVPKWINENCIMCNKCSTFCPHGVIRPFLIDKNEYEKLSDDLKNRCITPMIPSLKEYRYIISMSVKDCTGCGICINNCPGKKNEKALIFESIENSILNKEQEIFDYLVENIVEKNIENNNIINSQFRTPKFAFSGACAGCGETPYLKLLTQLFGKNLIISNATGCSSIYASSTPSMSYDLPWASSLFEDNAEYGYGMLIANKTMRLRIKKILEDNMSNPNKELFIKWLDNIDDFEITREVYEKLDYTTTPKELNSIKDYLVKRSVWIVGGDGWAYDIGYGGIDHVLSSNEDVKILVLDTQLYSNTGGQSSKSSPEGSVASFTSIGKKEFKKDLAASALVYPHVYVATISLGANPQQAFKAFKEAEEHKGPAIIIAYSTCISHGIKGGLEKTVEIQNLATESGFFPIFRYNPKNKEFSLDSKADFDKYESFLETQTRFNMLKVVNEKKALELLKINKENSIRRYKYYQSLENKNI